MQIKLMTLLLILMVFTGCSKFEFNPYTTLGRMVIKNGQHPAGNVGTLINKVDPINKGEVVWTITPQDLVIIGALFLTGKFNAKRVISLSGSSLKNPKYYTAKIGAEVSTFIYDSGLNEENVRVINGNVLSGEKIALKGHLGYYSDTFLAKKNL